MSGAIHDSNGEFRKKPAAANDSYAVNFSAPTHTRMMTSP